MTFGAVSFHCWVRSCIVSACVCVLVSILAGYVCMCVCVVVRVSECADVEKKTLSTQDPRSRVRF